MRRILQLGNSRVKLGRLPGRDYDRSMAQSPPASPPARQPSSPPRNRPDALAPMRTLRFWVVLAILFVLNVIISQVAFSAAQGPTVTISYNAFLDQVNEGNVVSITSTAESITGTTKIAVKDSSGTSATKFQTQRPSFANDDLESSLRTHNVVINAKDPNPPPPIWLTLLSSFGPVLLIVGAFLYLSRRAAQGGAGGILGAFGQSRARLYDAERPAVTFADVAGIDEVKADLEEVVDFLKEPQKY